VRRDQPRLYFDCAGRLDAQRAGFDARDAEARRAEELARKPNASSIAVTSKFLTLPPRLVRQATRR
jgi:hypothetical protein